MDAITTTTPIPLLDRLSVCAQLWIDANGASLSKLGKLVINDGAFFERLGPRGPSTETLEKFARFLADPTQWPSAVVPQEAREFAHVTGVPHAAENARG